MVQFTSRTLDYGFDYTAALVDTDQLDHNATRHITCRDSRRQRVFACTCSPLNIFYALLGLPQCIVLG